MQVIRDKGFTNAICVATFESNDNDFKSLFIAKKSNGSWVHVTGDGFQAGFTFTIKKELLATSFDYARDIWGFKDDEITSDAYKAKMLAIFGFEITSEELGALQYAYEELAGVNKSEMAKIQAYYLKKLIAKIEKIA